VRGDQHREPRLLHAAIGARRMHGSQAGLIVVASSLDSAGTRSGPCRSTRTRAGCPVRRPRPGTCPPRFPFPRHAGHPRSWRRTGNMSRIRGPSEGSSNAGWRHSRESTGTKLLGFVRDSTRSRSAISVSVVRVIRTSMPRATRAAGASSRRQA
jgi:hypothetical protein